LELASAERGDCSAAVRRKNASVYINDLLPNLVEDCHDILDSNYDFFGAQGALKSKT